jgi:hypothetical protein
VCGCDQVERDVDAAGLFRDGVGMLADGAFVERIHLGRRGRTAG